MQRIEHYEISALLAKTLKEEKETDVSLTAITQKSIMPDAMSDEP